MSTQSNHTEFPQVTRNYHESISGKVHKEASYKFNGKEQDDETGNYYYGARYYTAELGIWLSVDPLAEKYPNLSPYSFVDNNPVMFTDPNGMEVEYAGIKGWFDVQVSRLFSKAFRNEFNILNDKEDMVFTYKYNGKEGTSPGLGGSVEHTGFNDDRQETLQINYTKSNKNDLGGLGRSSKHALFEETYHAADYASRRGGNVPDYLFLNFAFLVL